MRLPIKGIGREYRAPKKPESDERQDQTRHHRSPNQSHEDQALEVGVLGIRLRGGPMGGI